MAILLTVGIYVEADGQVRWSLYTHQPAEAYGFPSVSRSGRVGGPGPDDGSGLREANILVAMEAAAMALATLSRVITSSYSLLPITMVQMDSWQGNEE